jgi:hypothetical protein
MKDAFSFVYARNAIAAFFKFMPALLNGQLTGSFHHFKNPETIQHLSIYKRFCFFHIQWFPESLFFFVRYFRATGH